MKFFVAKLFIVMCMVVARGKAATKTKCQVVTALKDQNVPNSDMRDWLCLVKHASDYKYDKTNPIPTGYTSYGIFQLNNQEWCNRGEHTSTCTELNTNGCGIQCSKLLNANINDDTQCAVRIKNCNSFAKWNAWVDNCEGHNLSENRDYDFNACLL